VDVFPSNVPLLGYSSYVHACGCAESSDYDLPGSNQMVMAQFLKLQSIKTLECYVTPKYILLLRLLSCVDETIEDYQCGFQHNG